MHQTKDMVRSPDRTANYNSVHRITRISSSQKKCAAIPIIGVFRNQSKAKLNGQRRSRYFKAEIESRIRVEKRCGLDQGHIKCAVACGGLSEGKNTFSCFV